MKTKFSFRIWTAVVCVVMSGMWLNRATVADPIIFGTGINQFNMEFVAIGNAGNAADTTGNPNPAGAVGYQYSMGKFEVSRDMINKANAVGSLGITLADMSTYGGNGADKPATGVSWNEAARFVNWLNTSTGGFAAYKFTTPGVNDNIALWTSADTLDYNASNPYRSLRANYVLPSMDEWYKAAYFDPNTGSYFNFPYGLDTAPAVVTSGTAANTAVYSQTLRQGPADIMSAGGLSPYRIMGMGGNVFELEETAFHLSNSSGSLDRELRGGFWSTSYTPDLSSSRRYSIGSSEEFGAEFLGFRVASLASATLVPEPSSWVLALIGISGLLYRRRMRNKDASWECQLRLTRSTWDSRLTLDRLSAMY